MASPLTLIIANIVMQDLEEMAITKLQIPSLFYFRYVDDITFLHFHRIWSIVHWAFSIVYTRLWRLDKIKDGICFLDTTIIINNQRIIFNTYHKAIFSGKFLNFYSNHPLCHKRDTIISFFRQNILSVTLVFNKKIWSTQFTFFLKMIIFFFIFSTIKKRN